MRNYKLCCTKLLDYGVVRYTAMANWYKRKKQDWNLSVAGSVIWTLSYTLYGCHVLLNNIILYRVGRNVNVIPGDQDKTSCVLTLGHCLFREESGKDSGDLGSESSSATRSARLLKPLISLIFTDFIMWWRGQIILLKATICQQLLC